jgi:uncharacterized repeat protein (TIGR01451 family)
VRPRGTVQNGKACTLATFEGLADAQPIPVFEGIASPGWLSLIEEPFGGTGNTRNDPSGITSAFWLDPAAARDIVPARPASDVSLYYNSYVPVTLTAYDSNGTVLDTAAGAPNFNNSTQLFDTWGFLSVNSTGNKIAKVTLSGQVNETGIDDLKVCTIIGVDSVEVTQAIQQYQTLADLKASLTANGEPPVPIVSGKPAVLRVYLDQVDAVGTVTVKLSGVATESKTMTVAPNCGPLSQRAQTSACRSMDFYFTPPTGNWTAQLDVLDSSANVLESSTLNITSRDTGVLHLRGVTVCDSPKVAGATTGDWNCALGSNLIGLTGLVSKLYPTNLVTTSGTRLSVYLDVTNETDPDGDWWDNVVKEVASNYGLFELANDLQSKSYTIYFGMIRPLNQLGLTGGQANGVLSHGAAAKTNVTRLGVETNLEVIAHETGHTLGLKHTNTIIPKSLGSPPGCYNRAADDTTDWPFTDNNVQSQNQFEVGFDVAARKPIDPNYTYDIMSYCTPRWISPQRYKTVLQTLNGGAVLSTSSTAVTERRAMTARAAVGPAGQYWQVRGAITGQTAHFDPLFTFALRGNTDPGSGPYSLVVQNSAGQALFTRQFTPQTSETETSGIDVVANPSFSEVIPVQAGAAAIVLKNASAIELGRITLSGAPPLVAITAPAAGFIGSTRQSISWTVSGATAFYSVLLYSADNGTTWEPIGNSQNNTSMVVDFAQMPGSTNALIRVLVSDGVNTGSATSPNFTVLKHAPNVVQIYTPADGLVQPASDKLHLTGTALDVDDGELSGTALQWSSNLQGVLGTGSPLEVTLQPGNHTITLTATDSDGNPISTSIDVVIGGAPPNIVLQSQAVDQAPTTCETITVNASPGVNGAALSAVRLSLDEGLSYTTIPTALLPFSITVPGSGYFHVVAQAADLSGQVAAADSTFFTQSACASAAAIASVNRNTGFQGQNLPSVAIVGTGTHFAQGVTVANFGPDITVNSLTVTSPTAATANITLSGSAPLGTISVVMATGAEDALLSGGFTVTAGYLLSLQVSPPNSGSIVPDKTFGNSYYPPNYALQLTAQPNAGYSFAGFSGDLTGTANPQALTMSSVHIVTATFVQAPNLTFGEAHTPSFTKGQMGAAYIITVSNLAGGGATTGAVTVTETLPAGLTLASISGANWTCNSSNATCTRSDSLAAGAAYPDIVVTVNVASNAPAVITNQVTLQGGGFSGSLLLTDDTNITVGVPFDIDGNGAVTVADVQRMLNEMLGKLPLSHDQNGDGFVNVVDVQLVIHALLHP